MGNSNGKKIQKLFLKKNTLENETYREEVRKLFKIEINNDQRNGLTSNKIRSEIDLKILVNKPFWLDPSYFQSIGSFSSSHSLYGVDCRA